MKKKHLEDEDYLYVSSTIEILQRSLHRLSLNLNKTKTFEFFSFSTDKVYFMRSTLTAIILLLRIGIASSSIIRQENGNKFGNT